MRRLESATVSVGHADSVCERRVEVVEFRSGDGLCRRRVLRVVAPAVAVVCRTAFRADSKRRGSAVAHFGASADGSRQCLCGLSYFAGCHRLAAVGVGDGHPVGACNKSACYASAVGQVGDVNVVAPCVGVRYGAAADIGRRRAVIGAEALRVGDLKFR